MTTGSYTRNYTSNYGIGTIGEIFQKSWSGANNPSPRPPKPPKLPPVRFVVKKMNRFGRLVDVKIRVPTVYPRLPKTTTRRALPPNDYSMNATYTRLGPCVLGDGRQFSPESAGFRIFGNIGSLDPNLQISVTNKLRESIQGSDFNAGIVAAEAHKTANLVSSTAKKLSLSYSALRKGRVFDAAFHLTGKAPTKSEIRRFDKKRSISSQWLELQYGWLPLLHDVQSGAEALAHAHHRASCQRFVVRGSRSTGKPRGPYADPASSNSSWTPETSVMPASFIGEEQIQIVAYVSSTDGLGLLGLTDPATIAWELVPYSFVVDWFIPIGDYLSAVQASRSIEGTFITTVSRKTSIDGVVWTGNPTNPNRLVGIGQWAERKISLTRSVSSSLSVPFPAVKPLKRIATVGHALNAMALVFARPPRTF